MSVYACLGTEAVAIREAYMHRLQSRLEVRQLTYPLHVHENFNRSILPLIQLARMIKVPVYKGPG